MRTIQYHSVYQLTYLPKLFPVNVYIVEYPDRLYLIDTGLEAMVKGILAFSEKKGKPIEKILITHSHADHIGGLEALKKALPNAKVYVSERDGRFLSGDFSLDANEPQLSLKGGYPKKPIAFDAVLRDGDVLDDIRCVALPGHTPGLMGYFVEKDRVCLVGDAIQTRGGLAVAGVVNLTFPFPALATWSKALAVESAEKLAVLEADVIGCGHGEFLHAPQKALKEAIKRAN